MSLDQVIEQAVANAINKHLHPIVERLNAVETRTPVDEFLNTGAAAQYLGISPITMSIWRCEDRGPEYDRIGGRSIRYRRSALDAFVKSNAGLIGKKGHPTKQLVQTVKTSGTIAEVCQARGCWFDLQGDGAVLKVRVKDAVFSVPVAAKGRPATAQGTVVLRDVGDRKVVELQAIGVAVGDPPPAPAAPSAPSAPPAPSGSAPAAGGR
jgi:predicted DNA-binding transcriptional regulator AlpA